MIDHIRADAEKRGEPIVDAVRHHLITGIIERVARSPARAAFVLRGGLLTREWIAPHRRVTRDLDFVGDFAFDRDDTAARFATALAITLADDIVIDTTATIARAIWTESEFPGVRLELLIGLGRADQRLTIDVGFNDPLVPPAVERTLARVDGSTFTARAVRPETQLGWKLHGLVEMAGNWRPKDLADLHLITKYVPLDRVLLPSAVEIAFTSRGYDPALARSIFDAAYWPTKTARMRWDPYVGRHGALADVVTEVRTALGEMT